MCKFKIGEIIYQKNLRLYEIVAILTDNKEGCCYLVNRIPKKNEKFKRHSKYIEVLEKYCFENIIQAYDASLRKSND